LISLVINYGIIDSW